MEINTFATGIRAALRRVSGLRPPAAAIARWSPFALGLAWTVQAGLLGELRYGLSLLLPAGGLGVAWLIARRLWPLALLLALALSPLAWRLEVALPGQLSEIRALGEGSYVRIRGTVRAQALEARGGRRELRLLLGEVRVAGGAQAWNLPEAEVLLPRRSSRVSPLFRRELRIGGVLREVASGGARPRLRLEQAEFHSVNLPIVPWRAEGLRAALRDRAGYYLSKPALAVYLPIVLGVRERGSLEAREVVETFRRVGISHLFAISGLHIGLLFGLLLFLSRHAVGLLLRRQGWLHTQTSSRVGIAVIVWVYIALIGFPVPAVRAAIMASMLLWSDLWGTRTPRLYVLSCAGLILVTVTPSIVYDISFQLSFLSFFFLLAGLELLGQRTGAPPEGGPPSLWARLRAAVATNLAVTLAITLGIWPVLALSFGRISLLVFAGNLLMIPILGVLVLPSGLVALFISMAHLGRLPGAWLERAVFGWLDWVLGGWLWLVEAIDRVGGALVFPVELGWRSQHVFLYYFLLIASLALVGAWRAVRR